MIGNIRLQLTLSKEVLHKLEVVRDLRTLSSHEETLRQFVKLKMLGLSSLQRNLAKQESRLLWPREGNAATIFFHERANARCRKNHIRSLEHDGRVVISEGKAEVVFSYFDSVLGTPSTRPNTIALELLDLTRLDPAGMDQRFMEEEVWSVIQAVPPDKAPG
jgi:hypothetical protein